MAIDWSLFSIPKPTPRVLVRKAKKRSDARAWRQCAKQVDERDKRTDVESWTDAPTCFITGRRLQTRDTFEEWTFRDRAHLLARSTNKPQRYFSTNVISCSRAVHDLIDKGVLFLLNKKGRPARTVGTIDHVMWNRRYVAKGEEPCRIRTGLAVREMVA